MGPTPRDYQADAIKAGLDFFHSDANYNALEVAPTGSGKSVIIANIAMGAEGNTVVFQPSKEILEQNYAKLIAYGFRAGVYSASVGVKRMEKITYATIGSVAKKSYLFKECKNIIIDECDKVNPKEGMYKTFLNELGEAKALGLTASPYRLASNSYGAELRFLTRQRPAVFKKLIYYIQNKTLFDQGHLCKLDYFAFDIMKREMLSLNSAGTDYTEASLEAFARRTNMHQTTAYYGNRLLAKRKNLLVFCSTINEAHQISRLIPGSAVLTGKTPKDERSRMIARFKSNALRCIVNVGVLGIGFDYPELECVLLGRPTMSLALYYQWIGRVVRPHEDKLSAWVVDLCGNIKRFGKVETLKIDTDHKGLYIVSNGGVQLTNVPFEGVKPWERPKKSA